ncbi:MAG: M48 family metallopeptidase [Phocaeicola sp.]
MEGRRLLADPDFKSVIVTPNKRAVQMTYRLKSDGLYVTVPTFTSDSEVLKGIDELRSRLLASREKIECKLIDWNFKIEAPYFKFSIIKGASTGFRLRVDKHIAQIITPASVDFSDENIQKMLNGGVESAMKKSAFSLFSPLLKELSIKYSLPFAQMKVTASKGRWGSCSGQKIINLSCYLILLPHHLIEYVLLHELAHTKEMNHGEKFWKLLDGMSNGKAQQLRAELKKYSTNY